MKTEIIKANSKAAAKAVPVLKKGGIVIYPTETLYGIGVDATNDGAVKKVIKLKKRSDQKLLIAFPDIKTAKKYLVITKRAGLLAKHFMPGPLSLIVETKTGRRNVGFRIPEGIGRSMARKLGKPITSTSANISGSDNVYKIKEIIKLFDGKVDMIINGGNIPKRKASTVYDTIERKVLREGPISQKRIEDVLKG